MKKIVLLGLAMAFVLGGAGALQADTIELKFAHFWSPMHNQHKNVFVPFAREVERLTGGNVKIKIYAGKALGGPKQLPDAVKGGIADIGFIFPFYITGRYPRSSAIELPFLFDSAIHGTKAIYDIYDKYIADDYKDYKVLWFFSSPPMQLHSVTKPMRRLEDLKGMKLRSPSAYGTKALKLLGSNPVGMPGSKLVMALRKKVIDGMLTVDSAIKDLKLFDLVKHTTHLDLNVLFMAVIMNREKYNSLSGAVRAAIDHASGRKVGLKAAGIYDETAKSALKKMKELGKTKIYMLPESEKKRFADKLKSTEANWVADMTRKGFPAKEIAKAVHRAAEKHR